ncbi:DUF2382 domain-containing protein [Nakamurella deserti]|uniref:DUF2382 domain-containing protein n=1 Tax=Nakamurella deserti TaxID=2164074 RepID=UPI000DBE9C8D|nr:PRC and DUF2382 domain-containing protein [Nakamurella deserti]
MIPADQAATIMSQGEVASTSGDTIGKVGQVYVDNADGHLTWVTVKTGWFGANESFVPLDNATLNGSTVTVPYDKDKVKNAPHHAVDAELSVDEENELYSYYGIGTAGQTATTTTTDTTDRTAADVTPEPRTTRDDDGYITRSEEQLHVGTRRVEAGRARLKKYVVTEQQTVTVPVSHEEVTLVREPVAAGDIRDAVIGEDAIEVTLTEDRVVVDKEAVAVERVSLGTEVVTEQQQVTETVRKEQVELDTTGVDTTTGHITTGANGRNDDDASLGDKAKGLVDKAKDALK